MKFSLFILLGALSLQTFGGQQWVKVADLRGKWKFSIGDNPRWSNVDFNDESWESITVPGTWEDQGFGGFDGYAWYRITVNLSNVNENNLYLDLGYIDDADEVYLNGELIGFTGSFPPNFYTAFKSHRQYYIPPDLINKNGKNIIAVRVYDTVLEGGIIKGNVGIYSKRNEPDKTFSLEGIWHFREGDNPLWKQSEYDDIEWDYIMAPGYWKSLKHKEIEEGTAWYRKEFELPAYLANESNLVLILGKIDDFDETYLNEKLVGETNDQGGYGWSKSYDQHRVYPIPAGILNKTGKNTISIRVRDIGGNAGIYEGPLVIIPQRSFKRFDIDQF